MHLLYNNHLWIFSTYVWTVCKQKLFYFVHLFIINELCHVSWWGLYKPCVWQGCGLLPHIFCCVHVIVAIIRQMWLDVCRGHLMSSLVKLSLCQCCHVVKKQNLLHFNDCFATSILLMIHYWFRHCRWLTVTLVFKHVTLWSLSPYLLAEDNGTIIPHHTNYLVVVVTNDHPSSLKIAHLWSEKIV